MTNKLVRLYEELQEAKEGKVIIENHFFETNEYKSLFGDRNKIRTERREMDRQSNLIDKGIYRKYFKEVRTYRIDKRSDNIISSVKQGIKRGLGLKFLKDVEDKIFERITQEIIDEERGNNNQLSELSKKWDILNDKENKIDYKIESLKKEKLGTWKEKIEEIYEKIKEEQKKERVKKEATTNSFLRNKEDFMDKIKIEVNKGLILDSLEDK